MDILSEKLSELGQENFHKIMSAPVQRRIEIMAKILCCEEEKQAVIWLSEALEIPFVEQFQFNRKYCDKLPTELFTSHGILPIEDVTGENRFCIISCWPVDEKLRKQMEVFCGEYPEICLGVPSEVIEEICVHFGLSSESERFVDLANENQED
jgi:hypothetical protein